jgi:putative FmdB family regulatory protein
MPLYEFVCRDCEQEQELLVRGDETPACQSCGGVRLAKLLSVPAAHLGGEAGARPFAGPAGGGCGSGCGCHPH